MFDKCKKSSTKKELIDIFFRDEEVIAIKRLSQRLSQNFKLIV
jgi:hypothetical protein